MDTKENAMVHYDTLEVENGLNVLVNPNNKHGIPYMCLIG